MPKIKLSDNDLVEALKTSFISKGFIDSDPLLRVQLLFNQKGDQTHSVKKIVSEIIKELEGCESFDFSVAFITDAGRQLLYKTLRTLEEKGVPGRILTTDYNLFTQPSALGRLSEFKNIKIKMFRCEEQQKFHTKGFIFHHKDKTTAIIGSSNLTQDALSSTKEWNVRLVSKKDGEFISSLEHEFNELWNCSQSHDLEKVLDDYTVEYEKKKKDERAARELLKNSGNAEPTTRLYPNTMQKPFIKNLTNYYIHGETRAMLISATGTGKTFAAAFAIRHLMNLKPSDWPKDSVIRKSPKKILFVVHREQIAKQALRSFKRINGANKTYGLLTGNGKKLDNDFTFATIQTISQDIVYKNIDANYFDVIIIDEVHRAGAKSYKKIMEHFKPEFWLGMTASPDRTDGEDIYSLFDHNIAYEIRLQDALNEDLLCPFHYYGISDLTVNNKPFSELSEFNCLEFKERVKHVLRAAHDYGFSGKRVKGLIFCSRNDEAKALEIELNKQGKRTLALSGKNSQQERDIAIQRLVSDVDDQLALDYIITVDIFNEGIDIPEINQVLLLRPTESSIIFIQQLGRGLRKAKDKDYVVVIDFIANYEKNYLIPIALSGDNSYQKESMRKYIGSGTKIIPGASTVEFEEQVKQQILNSIDRAKTNSIGLIKESYNILRHKLGRIPRLVEFAEHNAITPLKIFQNKQLLSYYNFLVHAAKENLPFVLDQEQIEFLNFLSIRVADAKRIAEAVLLELVVEAKPGEKLRSGLTSKLKDLWKIDASDDLINNVFLVLSGQFAITEAERNQTVNWAVVERTGSDDFSVTEKFRRALEQSKEFNDQIQQIIDFAKQRYLAKFKYRYKDTSLVLYETYSYADTCRLLNWPKNLNGQNIGGYKYDTATKTFPVFVNYRKDDDAIAYEDHFESDRLLVAISKTKRSVDSPDADRIYKRKPENKDNRIFLFVRKNKEDQEAKLFYFLGEIEAEGQPEKILLQSKSQPEKKDNAFKIRYKLETAVRSDIYDYITGE